MSEEDGAMPFVTTEDDCEIWYEVHGSGPTVAFASGFMGITDIWREQIDALAGRYRCVAFDNRGAGRSDKPFPRVAYGVERHARDLEVVLGTLGVGRAVLVGHSMGGSTAATYALAHREEVAGLVFVGSFAAGAQIVAVGNTPEKIKAAVRTKDARVAFYTGVGLPEPIAMESTKWPLYALLGNAESFLEFDVRDRLGELTMPCLVIHGGADVVTPLDPCGRSLADGLPDAALEIFPGVNHCPMTEDPRRTSELLLAFLERRVRW
jgi:pimeloyl-ACP methyl ester carboxylesterase